MKRVYFLIPFIAVLFFCGIGMDNAETGVPVKKRAYDSILKASGSPFMLSEQKYTNWDYIDKIGRNEDYINPEILE